MIASARSRLKKNKLEISELRYRRLFETAQDGILILNVKTGKITDSNPYIEKILGYTKKELLGKELWEIGIFKDISESKEAFEVLQSKKYIRYLDLPLETKKGRKIEVEFVSNVYAVGNSKVIQCNIRDITDRIRSENVIKAKNKSLRISEAKQKKTQIAMLNVLEDLEAAKRQIEYEKVKDDAILESIGEGLIAVNNKKKIINVNRAAVKMLGWEPHELIGQPIHVLPIETESGKVIPTKNRPTNIALKTGKTVSSTFYFHKKNGKKFPIAINVTPIRLGKKIIGAVDIFRDITKEAEINRAKSEFVSLASHQLRTPLGISKWYLEAIVKEKFFLNAPKTSKTYLNEVYVSIERLIDLVSDLLSVSRIDQGRIKDTPKLVDVSLIIERVTSEVNILAKKENITIEQRISPRIPPICIDPLRLQEVLENLITNAINYSKPGGKIIVFLNTDKKNLILSVQDNGIGISVEDKAQLFTRFFRAANAITKNPEGSGLGLYVIKSYVHAWGGKVTVQSMPGLGSTFIVTLPLKRKKLLKPNTESR